MEARFGKAYQAGFDEFMTRKNPSNRALRHKPARDSALARRGAEAQPGSTVLTESEPTHFQQANR
jgi:hypothetical protein